VVSEFVFSLVLLILGLLLTSSFVKLQHTSPGFNANNLLTFRVIAPEVNYGKFTWGEKDPCREKLYEKIEQVLTEVPGVESVALAANLPLAQNLNPVTGARDGSGASAQGNEAKLQRRRKHGYADRESAVFPHPRRRTDERAFLSRSVPAKPLLMWRS